MSEMNFNIFCKEIFDIHLISHIIANQVIVSSARIFACFRLFFANIAAFLQAFKGAKALFTRR